MQERGQHFENGFVRPPIAVAAAETYRWALPTLLMPSSSGDEHSRGKSRHTFHQSLVHSSITFGRSTEADKQSVVLGEIAELKRRRRELTHTFDRYEIAVQLADRYRLVGQHRKAENWYQEALLSASEEELVNQYRPQLYTLEDRKVERMSKPKIAEYYKTNEAELARLVETALRRQHERHFYARKSLFETALQRNQADKAIAQADLLIELCASKGEAEALECKRWIHQTLVNNHKAVKKACKRDQLIEQGRHSICGEYHLRLILELLTLEPTNTDLLAWAGRLHAEKCQFAESKYYFQRAAANGAEVKEPPAKFELPVQPPMLWSYQVESSEHGVDDVEAEAKMKQPQRPMPTAHAIIYPATIPDLQRGVLPVRSPQRLLKS